jgi:hypothetical protein
MIVNGEDVKVCSENLARWAPELRDHISAILGAANLSEKAQEIQRSAELADQMLNGMDKNEDGQIEPVSEECGVLVAYDSTYHMADMPLLPVIGNPLAQATLTALAETVTVSPTATPLSPLNATPTKQPGQSAIPVTVAPTSQSQPQPQPTSPSNNNNQPKPTKKPKPTDRPNQPGPNPHPTRSHP